MDIRQTRRRLFDLESDLSQMINEAEAWQQSILDVFGKPMTPEQVRKAMEEHQAMVSRIWWASTEGKLTVEMVKYLLGDSPAETEG